MQVNSLSLNVTGMKRPLKLPGHLAIGYDATEQMAWVIPGKPVQLSAPSILECFLSQNSRVGLGQLEDETFCIVNALWRCCLIDLVKFGAGESKIVKFSR